MQAVPNSAGTRAPAQAVPPNACDAHIHIYDAGLAALFIPDRAAASLPVAHATADHYRLLQQRLGTRRTVVVNPRSYGDDNRVTLDAIRQLGSGRTRGIAVVRADVAAAQLQILHAGGIRGIRFSLYTGEHPAIRFDMVEPLAQRVHALGWHVQLHWTADQIVQHEAMLLRLPCPMVFDHLARLPVSPTAPQGSAHPAFAIVRRLLDSGRAWVKLSGAYLDSRAGAGGGYADVEPIVRAWVDAAPERLVWGSDWPHPTERDKPDDAMLLDLFMRWAGNDASRQRILVDNPARLYGFVDA